MNEDITHLSLCKKTAEWAIKKNTIVLYDYQSFSTGEFPDCLAFDGSVTTLYEIKIARADFLGDSKKDCRRRFTKELTRRYYWETDPTRKVSEYYSCYQIVARDKESPHLGLYRYYVCPKELIEPDETGAWGLIWYKNNRFSIRKDSLRFKNCYHSERAILVHALRKERNVGNDNVLVKPY